MLIFHTFINANHNAMTRQTQERNKQIGYRKMKIKLNQYKV